MEADDERLEGRTLRENVVDPKTGEVLFKRVRRSMQRC